MLCKIGSQKHVARHLKDFEWRCMIRTATLIYCPHWGTFEGVGGLVIVKLVQETKLDFSQQTWIYLALHILQQISPTEIYGPSWSSCGLMRKPNKGQEGSQGTAAAPPLGKWQTQSGRKWPAKLWILCPPLWQCGFLSLLDHNFPLSVHCPMKLLPCCVLCYDSISEHLLDVASSCLCICQS